MGNTPRSQCLSSRECLALCSYTVRNRTLFLPPASRERLWLLPGVAVLTLDPRGQVGPAPAPRRDGRGRRGEDGAGRVALRRRPHSHRDGPSDSPASSELELSRYLFCWHFYCIPNANSQPVRARSPSCCSLTVVTVARKQRRPLCLETLEGAKLPSNLLNRVRPGQRACVQSCLQTACRRLALLHDLWLFHFNLAKGGGRRPSGAPWDLLAASGERRAVSRTHCLWLGDKHWPLLPFLPELRTDIQSSVKKDQTMSKL